MLALVAGLSVGCGEGGAPAVSTLHVLAASSLTDGFQEVSRDFGDRHGARVALNFGASSQLRAQLELGARADVFASADEVQMELAAAARLIAGQPVVFARNRLVVVTPMDSPPVVSELADLGRPGRRLAMADPSVPVGRYALQALDALSQDPALGPDFRQRVERNAVTREANVRQLVAKVELGEADAAIVYASDARAAGRLRPLVIPEPFNVEARYLVAPLQGAAQPGLAQSFIGYLLSDDTQAILERHGFLRVR